MATIYLTEGETNFTVSNNNTTLIGSTGTESVTIASGVTGTVLDQSTESVTLIGNISAYTFQATGNVISVFLADGTTLVATLPLVLGATDTSMTFDDGEKALLFSSTGGLITVGGDAVSTATPTELTATPVTPVVDGQTFVLTTSSDLITGSSGTDTINAKVGTNSANGNLADTFQSVDIIDGGDGTDTLNISIASAIGAVGPTISNVENIVFTGFVAQALNLVNTSSLEKLTNKSSIVAASYTNVANSVELAVENINNQTTTMAYAAAVNTTLADSQTLTLNNAVAQAVVTITGAGTAETLNVVTTGAASTVDIGGTALAGTTTMIITGDQNLSFDDTDAANAMAALTTLNASALTGTLDANLSTGGTVNLAITGTAQDDLLTIRNVTKDDVVDLGDGIDKLTTNFAANTAITTAPAFTNVETLAITPVGNNIDVSMNLASATSLTSLEIGVDDGGDGDSVTVTKAAAGLTTVKFDAGGIAADGIVDTLGFALNAASGAADALTLDYTNLDASGNLINTTLGVQITSVATANNIENITVTTAALHADTSATVQDGGLALTLNGDRLQTLTIVSESLVDATGVALDASVKTVDASDANGGVLLDLSLAADADNTTGKTLTVTTGTGNDSILGINTDASVAATISTGAGNDTFSIEAGALDVAITIDAGAGIDAINISADTSTVAIVKTITTGAGIDTVTIDNATAADITDIGVVITDFTAGVGGDIINFNGAIAATNGTTITTGSATAAANVIAATTAMFLSGTVVSEGAGATSANIFDDGAGDYATNIADNEVIYVAYSDGTDTFIAIVTDNIGADLADDTAVNEVSVLVTLTGVSDALTLTVGNFTDFLA